MAGEIVVKGAEPSGGQVEVNFVNEIAISRVTGLQTALNGKAMIDSVVLVTTTTKTVGVDETIMLVNDDTAGGIVTVTLSTASTYPAAKYNIKKIGSTANVLIQTADTATIDGQATITLNTQYDSVTLATNGTNWFIL